MTAAALVVSLPGPGCRLQPKETTAQVFPQGVASGDPRPDGVVLWTRVEPLSTADDERVSFKVARSLDNGYGIVEVDRNREIRVQFVIVGDVLEPAFGGQVKRIRMRTPAGTKRIIIEASPT